ncbi:MAG: hypothetical protein HY334_05790 [Armatimonadetes bacterium]|nr:hypothetical protein [Armatimonadota bacterium]
MAPANGLGPSDRKLLAGIIHQVWRTCQAFVSILMERGPEEAAGALDDLARWSAARRRALAPRSTRRPRVAAPPAQRIGRELLDDVETFCLAAGAMVARLTSSSLDSAEVEEEALSIVEGFLAWTNLMAAQLGITRSLKPQTLWFER